MKAQVSDNNVHTGILAVVLKPFNEAGRGRSEAARNWQYGDWWLAGLSCLTVTEAVVSGVGHSPDVDA